MATNQTKGHTMQAHLYEAQCFASPDAMNAVAHYVSHEYGDYGYQIGLAMTSGAVGVFEVRHSDGSAFNVVADRWGNVRRVPDDASSMEAVTIIRDMHRNAVTP
jgi:hypothetical protein